MVGGGGWSGEVKPEEEKIWRKQEVYYKLLITKKIKNNRVIFPFLFFFFLRWGKAGLDVVGGSSVKRKELAP